MIPPDFVAHVEPDGRFLGWVARERVHDERLIHLSVNVLVFHPDGRLLVQRSHRDKRTYPGFWDVSCSGHVDYADFPNGDGEREADAFQCAAPRELKEELGVTTPMEILGLYPPEPTVNYERTMVFRTVCAGPFVLQATEVESVRWIGPKDLADLHPSTPLLRWMVTEIMGW